MFIKVRAFPSSKESNIIQKSSDSFEVKLKAKPQKGEANKEILRLLANFFGSSPSQIRLVKGGKQRNKIFEIPDELNQVEEAVKVLKKRGVIVYPTDTVYGIGCNVFDEKAVKKIFEIKGRNFNKPLSVAVSDFRMLEQLVFVNAEDEKFLQKILPGPITVILPKKPIVPDLVTAGTPFLGVRIPDYKLVQEIIEKAGFPIISTSANVSGDVPPVDSEGVVLKADLVLKGNCKYKEASTVIDWEKKEIIREGAGLKRVKFLFSSFLTKKKR